MKTIIALTNLFTFPGFKVIWDNIGYYIAVGMALMFVFGMIEGAILYVFDPTGKRMGVVGLICYLFEGIFYWIGEKITDLYDDIVFALSKK